MSDQFQGICPICYKPVRTVEKSRTITNDDRSETYHDRCIIQYVSDRLPKHVRDQGLSIVEEHVNAIMLNDYKRRLKRVEWVKQNKSEWEYYGSWTQCTRKEYGLTLKQVAHCIGISVARLKRFEAGMPVRDAKLLYQGYISALYINELERKVQAAHAFIEDQEMRLKIATDLLVENEVDKITYAMISEAKKEQVERDGQHEHI
jgi:transcriptional regulator with XRE-family HTH domain